MAKITSKYQVTVPKAITEKYHLRPDPIDWIAAGEVIRVIPPGKQDVPEDRESRLRLFDLATGRHNRRASLRKTRQPRNRGWKRADLYGRGRSRFRHHIERTSDNLFSSQSRSLRVDE